MNSTTSHAVRIDFPSHAGRSVATYTLLALRYTELSSSSDDFFRIEQYIIRTGTEKGGRFKPVPSSQARYLILEDLTDLREDLAVSRYRSDADLCLYRTVACR